MVMLLHYNDDKTNKYDHDNDYNVDNDAGQNKKIWPGL